MKINEILKQQLELIKPSNKEVKEIISETNNLLDKIKNNLNRKKIYSEVFVGGSAAKNTLIKKKKYDIDIFVRFDKRYSEEEIAKFLKSIVPKNAKKIRGSRDYYSIKGKNNLEFEIIPTVKIKSPKEAQNITDLSYFHVHYVDDKIRKRPKLADEIRMTKAFAYYQDCYGAESYINGFSGYAIELLIIHYKSFLNFIKAMAKLNLKEKQIIDMARLYKDKKQILENMNKSKLHSPIILIDPTYKERNALAALSYKTFQNFQKACKLFLKNPSPKFFQIENKQEKLEKKYKDKLIRIEVKSSKQAGDIAGTKLKKFHKYFINQTNRYFIVDKTDFDYNEDKNIGIIYLVAKPKKQIEYLGPPIKFEKPLKAFKKEHKKVQIKKGRAYSTEKNNLNFPKFLKKFKNEKKEILKEMGISNIN